MGVPSGERPGGGGALDKTGGYPLPVRTGYGAGGTPLAVTREDFFVITISSTLVVVLICL